MSEQALYRKYRSASFDTVIGQDHIVATLRSALAAGNVRHAYLFTGPRGVGKTSVARLLAKALNCTGDPKPCGACASCLTAINSSLDIIEMDAASNRSIDSIRDLREKLGLAPTAGKYKVYIIDEVHMLTSEAFNALLKTLEEPPAHAVFILATTEAHKLPETIISRTQSFRFKPIQEADLMSHLTTIAAAEHITIEPEALAMVARAARGGFRDAISMLDQLGSTGESNITTEYVMQTLGYSAHEEIATICHAIAGGDVREALTILGRLEAAGAQPAVIASQLAEEWRAALMAATGVTGSPSALSAKLASVAPNRIVAITKALLEVTSSGWPQLSLEATIAALCLPAVVPTQAPTPATTPTSTPPKKTAKSAPATAAPEPASPEEAVSSKLWPKVLARVKAENNSLGALLQMYPVDFSDSEIIIKPRFNFHRDLFIKPANRSTIESAAARVYGQPVKISARTEEVTKAGRKASPDPTAELVTSALEILGGEVVE